MDATKKRRFLKKRIKLSGGWRLLSRGWKILRPRISPLETRKKPRMRRTYGTRIHLQSTLPASCQKRVKIGAFWGPSAYDRVGSNLGSRLRRSGFWCGR